VPAKDAAAYMRQYRAARRQPVEPRSCERCRQDFTPARSDARYCSDACRAAARRERVDVTWRHNPAGWPAVSGATRPDPCASVVFGSGCEARPTWQKTQVYHADALERVSHWCDDHKPDDGV
jgi:hypothetical protein